MTEKVKNQSVVLPTQKVTMKIKSLLKLLCLSAMLTLNFSSCNDDDNDVTKEPESEKITDVTSSNMSDYLKSQTSGSTITVALTETNPDFAKIREALSNNANVNVKLDLAKCTDLKEIPENAFYKSDNSLKKVGGENGFKNLVAIILPETVVKIGNNAFRDCILLAEINLPDKTEEIGNYVFANCQSLTLIVIPKSVLKIGENVFEGCTQIEIKNNSNVSLDNNQDENFEILPKKITKIVGHYQEPGYDEDRGSTDYYIYDSEDRLQYLITEPQSETSERITHTFTYTDNEITSTSRQYIEKWALVDGKIVSYLLQDKHGREESSFKYIDGFVSKINTGLEYTYIINDDLITSLSGQSNDLSSSNLSQIKYEYTNIKNNLNFDLFSMINPKPYTMGEYLSKYYGKRNKLLPSKVTDNYEYGYDYTFTYELDGDYITKIEIKHMKKDGQILCNESYEIYYDPIDITPEPEEYVEQ